MTIRIDAAKESEGECSLVIANISFRSVREDSLKLEYF